MSDKKIKEPEDTILSMMKKNDAGGAGIRVTKKLKL